MTNNGSERRNHVRFPKVLGFYCYVEGRRFDSESLDVSAGGAFLSTEDEFDVGNSVILVPKAEANRGLTGLLVGAVVRLQRGPSPGLGIQWRRCVSRTGYQTLYYYLTDYLAMEQGGLLGPSPEVMESDLVTYDFSTNQMYVPEGPGLRGARGAAVTEEPLPEESLSPNELARGSEPGIVTQMLGTQGGRLPVDIPARFYLGDVISDGMLKAVGLATLFLATDAEDVTDEGTCVVSFPVPLASGPVELKLFCTVVGYEEGKSLGYKGYDLAIRSIEEEPHKGLYESYLKYLFDRLYALEL